ncbi:MAG: alcohol dehydrogenase catalytic domain-containing protein [Chloroflexi bacterium]|nr:alcohol dehydrogenase catalytic domain-containing protein [Chloroflexota bacterium]
MRAFVMVEPRARGARLIERAEPALGPDHVLIRIEAAGICGTDLKVLEWAPNIAVRAGSRLPLTMGHEGAGVIHAVGSAVQGLAPGDRVAPVSIHYCRQCRFCREGRSSICDNRPTLGIERDGVFAEYLAVPADRVSRIGQDVSLEAAALLDPIAVALQAFERVSVGADDVVAIVGAGTIGLILALVARVYAPKRLLLFGLQVDRDRLRLANSLGVEAVEAQDPAVARRVVDSVTHGYGADVVFEAGGHPVAVQTAINLGRKGATVGLVGLPFGPTEIFTSQLVWAEKTLVAIRGFNQSCWDRALAYIGEGSLDLTPLVTHRLPLAEAERGFDLLERREALKVILRP